MGFLSIIIFSYRQIILEKINAKVLYFLEWQSPTVQAKRRRNIHPCGQRDVFRLVPRVAVRSIVGLGPNGTNSVTLRAPIADTNCMGCLF